MLLTKIGSRIRILLHTAKEVRKNIYTPPSFCKPVKEFCFYSPCVFLEFDTSKIIFQAKRNKIRADWQMELSYLDQDGDDQADADEQDDDDDDLDYDQDDGDAQDDDVEGRDDVEDQADDDEQDDDLDAVDADLADVDEQDDEVEFLYSVQNVIVITLC